jgi:hypothetical protein
MAAICAANGRKALMFVRNENGKYCFYVGDMTYERRNAALQQAGQGR